MSAAQMNLAGKYIVVDGPDGAGKSVQLDRLKELVENLGGEWVYARDPGGTDIGDRIRHVLLGYDLSQMDVRCETLLFMASRSQLVAEVVRPALAAGKTVLGDRFISATCAYQVAAGFDRDAVITLGRLAVGNTWPDLTIVLDVPVEVGFERTGRKRSAKGGEGQYSMFEGATTDAMERRPIEYHRRVREIFRTLPTFYPAPVEVIDASRDRDAVFCDVQAALGRTFA
ncbi:MAG: dTMP kinase [Phycisphaerales bacterium]|nr:dTMP kinase [Phycisphaerales bacterium]